MNRNSTVALRSGRAMPVLGLGTWELTEDTSGTVERALRVGYRMVDTASDYGTQPGIGDALRRGEVERDDVFIVAKVEETDDADEATERYVAEIGVDKVDLVLIHRPPATGAGEQLWEGLVRARDDGLTDDIGVSNYSIEQIDQIVGATGQAPVVNQIEWSPFGWSPEMLDACRERQIVVQAYSPLTRGRRLDDRTLAEVADDCGATPAQVLLRWSLQKAVVPLPKANRIEHAEENLGAFDVEIDDEGMRRLDELNEHYSALGSLPYV